MNHRLSPHALLATRLKKAVLLSMSLAALQLSGCSSMGGGTTTEHAHLEPEVSSRLQQVLDTAAADKASKYPGVILRIETPKGTWNGTSGVSSIETKGTIDPQAKFRAGSILKPFISTVILQLVEEEKLSLENRLSDLLAPEITGLFEYSDSITLKMLLNHTSGIGEWTGELDRDSTFHNLQDKIWLESELFNMAAQKGTNFRPGEKYEYNNTEYNLLGLIIESKTGTSWRENIRQRIFTRLALKNTLLPEPGTIKMPGSYINGYEMYSGVITDTTDLDPSMAGAAGGHALVTNTEDLSIFIQALLKGVFFEKAETLSTMLAGVATDAPWRTYGLGIGRYTLPNGSYAYGHTGSTAGYATFVFHFPEEDVTASSVITADQGGAFMGFLLPSMGLVAEHLQDQK